MNKDLQILTSKFNQAKQAFLPLRGLLEKHWDQEGLGEKNTLVGRQATLDVWFAYDRLYLRSKSQELKSEYKNAKNSFLSATKELALHPLLLKYPAFINNIWLEIYWDRIAFLQRSDLLKHPQIIQDFSSKFGWEWKAFAQNPDLVNHPKIVDLYKRKYGWKWEYFIQNPSILESTSLIEKYSKERWWDWKVFFSNPKLLGEPKLFEEYSHYWNWERKVDFAETMKIVNKNARFQLIEHLIQAPELLKCYPKKIRTMLQILIDVEKKS